MRGCSCWIARRSPSPGTIGQARPRHPDQAQSEIVASRQWDERRLAYPVNGHKKGTYLLTYFKTDGSNLKEIVADCHLSDVILRELILKVHPKLVDHLVTQAMTSTPNGEAKKRAREEDTTIAPAAAGATTERASPPGRPLSPNPIAWSSTFRYRYLWLERACGRFLLGNNCLRPRDSAEWTGGPLPGSWGGTRRWPT